jgi:DNA-binding response OmpR family regulator
MALKVAIFEDDKDLADDLKNDLNKKGFDVSCIFSLEDDWLSAEIILADFRNRIVPFEDLKKLCLKNDRPLIAISGAESDHRPQVLKPFTIEQLQNAILSTLMAHNKKKQDVTKQKKKGFFSSLFGGSKAK